METTSASAPWKFLAGERRSVPLDNTPAGPEMLPIWWSKKIKAFFQTRHRPSGWGRGKNVASLLRLAEVSVVLTIIIIIDHYIVRKRTWWRRITSRCVTKWMMVSKRALLRAEPNWINTTPPIDPSIHPSIASRSLLGSYWRWLVTTSISTCCQAWFSPTCRMLSFSSYQDKKESKFETKMLFTIITINHLTKYSNRSGVRVQNSSNKWS